MVRNTFTDSVTIIKAVVTENRTAQRRAAEAHDAGGPFVVRKGPFERALAGVVDGNPQPARPARDIGFSRQAAFITTDEDPTHYG